MTGPWLAAFVALGGTVILLAAFTLGLAHRILLVLQRVDAALHDTLARPDTVGLPTGTPAPRLPTAVPATTETSGEAKGGHLLLFVEAECEPCRVLADDLRRHRPDLHGLRPVVVSTGATEWLLPALDEWTIVADPNRSVFDAWQVEGTPLAFAIDTEGVIRDKEFPNTADDVSRLCRQSSRHPHSPHETVVSTAPTSDRMTAHAPSRRTRRGFLRQAASVLGTGIGIALIPAAANAEDHRRDGVRCCKDSTCAFCPGDAKRYRCTNRCTGQVFCGCFTGHGECFSGAC